jgi:hypothetical protein
MRDRKPLTKWQKIVADGTNICSDPLDSKSESLLALNQAISSTSRALAVCDLDGVRSGTESAVWNAESALRESLFWLRERQRELLASE